MKAEFTKAKVILDGEDAFLCVSIPYRDAKKFVGEMKPKKYQVEIREYKKSRSLDANAYMWLLCTRLAEARSKDGIKVTKEDVYREEITSMGIYRDYSNLPLPEAKTLQTAWGMLGTGWITEQVDFSKDGENVTIRCYYGSSQYNTKQMSNLISNIVQDCQAVGIDTRTPEEIANMLSLWKQGE